jgi:hypothetical protein
MDLAAETSGKYSILYLASATPIYPNKGSSTPQAGL